MLVCSDEINFFFMRYLNSPCFWLYLIQRMLLYQFFSYIFVDTLIFVLTSNMLFLIHNQRNEMLVILWLNRLKFSRNYVERLNLILVWNSQTLTHFMNKIGQTIKILIFYGEFVFEFLQLFRNLHLLFLRCFFSKKIRFYIKKPKHLFNIIED